MVEAIDLSVSHEDHDQGHTAFVRNQSPILALMASLSGRNGIPEHWHNYWTDPAYKPGRIKASRKGLFERNGCTGDDIYTHPNFIRHLRFLLIGSELPLHLREAFARKLGDPKWVSSGDAIELGKYARKLTRENGMNGSESAEEFFKLALDVGLGLTQALIIMETVRQVR